MKGSKLYLSQNKNTRPLKDLARESIFNLLIHSNDIRFKFKDTLILDLFSGTGSFGLECLSRGSSNVTFVENYNNVLPILKKNILNLNYQKNSEVVEKDIINNLDFKNLKKKFDIIFMDPPYKEKYLFLLLNNVIESSILNKNGIIIIHMHKKEEGKFPKEFNIIEKKTYGISKIIFGRFF